MQEIFRSTFGTSLIIADVKRNHISSGANPDSCAGIGGRGDLARFCVQGERRTDLSHGAGYRVQFLHNNSKNAAMNSQHRQHIQTGYSQNARHARDTPAMPSFASWPRTSSVISSLQSAAVIGVAPDAQNLACLDLRGPRDDLFPVEPRYSARGTLMQMNFDSFMMQKAGGSIQGSTCILSPWRTEIGQKSMGLPV